MQNTRINSHTTIIALLALLLIGCGVVGFVYTGQLGSAIAKQSASKVTIEWELPVGSIKHLAFSSCGRYVYTVTADDTLNAYSSAGNKCYTVKNVEADRIVVCPNGKFAMLYSRLDPAAPKLTFLDSRGRIYWKMKVKGAIWCADAFSDQDCSRFVVGTGQGYVYVIDVGRNSKRYTRWRAPGAVVSINADSDDEAITLGTWQGSTILRATNKGKRFWERDADSNCLQYVESLKSSDRVVNRSIPSKAGGDGTLIVLDKEGNRLWQRSINSIDKTRILASPNGEYVCLGNSKSIEHKGKYIRERHGVLLDGSGRTIWDKGSLFFQADPILVTCSGCVLLSDGKRELFTITSSGELDPCIKLPAQIKRSVASKDGFRLLLHCSNGKLYMLRVSQ